MQKKEWSKIANQIKFKNFIRTFLKKIRAEPTFLQKKFKIFSFVDKLHKARMARMVAVKKIMARQMVEQNSLKFEIIDKMNNLASLAQFKSQYGNVCRDVDKYYERIEQ